MEFSGRLAAFPIADLLSWAQNDRRTGSLVVRKSGAEKRIYFREGDVVACVSSDPSEYYGQFLLAQGWVSEEGLIRALGLCQAERQPLGSALERLGLLAADRVAATLREHVEDQVCGLFLWRNGIFYLTNEMLPDAHVLPEPISATGLALEGSRRVDEHSRMRRLFVHDYIVLGRVRGMKSTGAESALAARILDHVDGKRPLVEVYNEVRGSWFRFLESAFDLTVGGALEVLEVQDAVTEASGFADLDAMLLEQIAQERSVLYRQHLSIPLDAVESAYPVWVRPSVVVEEGGATRDLLATYRLLDGRTRWGDVLAAVDDEAKDDLFDRFVLELREGRLALLPFPAEAPVAPDAAPAEGQAADAAAADRQSWWRSLMSRRARK